MALSSLNCCCLMAERSHQVRWVTAGTSATSGRESWKWIRPTGASSASNGYLAGHLARPTPPNGIADMVSSQQPTVRRWPTTTMNSQGNTIGNIPKNYNFNWISHDRNKKSSNPKKAEEGNPLPSLSTWNEMEAQGYEHRTKSRARNCAQFHR